MGEDKRFTYGMIAMLFFGIAMLCIFGIALWTKSLEMPMLGFCIFVAGALVASYGSKKD